MKTFIFLGILLAVLNALDGIFTYVGLNAGHIGEANPLLSWLPPLALLLLKLGFSAGLFYFILNPQYIPYKKFMFPLFIVVNIVYTFIIGLHIIWMVLAF